jgi:hypothetical protein
MKSLERRLQQLEQESAADRSRIIWIEPAESQEDALRQVRPLESNETPVFVGWRASALNWSSGQLPFIEHT